jgi:uncharacterized protein YrzB (UPF0473 family)
MADIKNNEEMEEALDILTLTDGETGEEKDFELLEKAEIDGKIYFALLPVEEDAQEYVILRAEADGDDMTLETVDDDEEFDKVADYFDDLFFESEEE